MGAAICQVIGHVALVFRPNLDKPNRIQLPKRLSNVTEHDDADTQAPPPDDDDDLPEDDPEQSWDDVTEDLA
jgi:hypothetical protein